MKINDTDFTLFKDYDKHAGVYPKLTFGGKVTYLEARVAQILIEPCRTTMNSDHKTALAFVLVTAICAGISAASTYLNGARAAPGQDKKIFVDFVSKYMDPILASKGPDGIPFVDWLYKDVRCGLAHNFTIMTGGIEHEASAYIEVKPCGQEIRPDYFLEDFAKGWAKFLAEVRHDGQGNGLGKKFHRRFDEVFMA